MSKHEFCKRADKPCRTEQEAKEVADKAAEYRRAYKCEFCEWWHLTSREKREDVQVVEPQERDVC